MALTSSSHVVPARHGEGFVLDAGQQIRIVDPEGGQVGDVFAFVKDRPDEYHSAAHTRARVGRLFPTIGEQFLTTRRRPILTLIDDTSPRHHDMLMPACDPARYAELGAAEDHASCAENLRTVAAQLGIEVGPIPQPINVFMRVPVAADGRLSWQPADSRPGDAITFEAVLDCVVAVSACPQDVVGINGGQPTRLAVEVLDPAG